MTDNMPTATKWLLTSVGSDEQPAVKSVYMIVSGKTDVKGTAFALSTGLVITNEHVVRGSDAGDLVLIASTGERLSATSVMVDPDVDLAVLQVNPPSSSGLRIQVASPAIGERVHTWGYPLAYNGPSPLLAVGYLAGFSPKTVSRRTVKHYIVNGAFNPGNSGGPLFAAVDDAVVGVVVSKHAPITEWHLSALEALKNQTSGFMYTATDTAGNTYQFSEGQLVGDLLQYFREMTQVVIGEAIAAEELIDFLDRSSLPWEAESS